MRAVERSTVRLLFRPFVVLAARALGPGTARLRLVKLAHSLDYGGAGTPPAQPTERAA